MNQQIINNKICIPCLPCFNLISSGFCCYYDRCCYIHDIRCYNTNLIIPRKNKYLVNNQTDKSFYWPKYYDNLISIKYNNFFEYNPIKLSDFTNYLFEISMWYNFINCIYYLSYQNDFRTNKYNIITNRKRLNVFYNLSNSIN